MFHDTDHTVRQPNQSLNQTHMHANIVHSKVRMKRIQQYGISLTGSVSEKCVEENISITYNIMRMAAKERRDRERDPLKDLHSPWLDFILCPITNLKPQHCHLIPSQKYYHSSFPFRNPAPFPIYEHYYSLCCGNLKKS